MKNENFYRVFIKLTLPLICQQFLNVSLNLADNLMIGRLGETAIASVGFANKYYMVFNITLFGAFSGCSIFIAQFYGKKDYEILKKIFAVMIMLAVFFFSIFGFLGYFFPEFVISIFSSDPEAIRIGSEYLKIISLSYPMTAVSLAVIMSVRSMGKTMQPLVVSFVAVMVNVVLNYILINGKMGFPVLGVNGSAYATLIARILEVCMYILLIYIKGYYLKGKIKSYLGLSKEIIISMIKISTPVLLTEIIWVCGTAALTIAYAKAGTEQVASVQIGELLLNMSTIVFMGIANASSIIIGQAIGAGNHGRAMEMSRKIMKIAFVFSVICALFLEIIAKPGLVFYTLKPEVLEMTVLVIRVLGVAVFFKMLNWTMLIGILRAGGDTKVAFLLDTVFLIFYAVPVAFLGTMVFKLPVYQVVALANLEEVIKFIFALWRYKSKKWLHDLTGIVKH
jgi:putative MATE family efflux protein